MTDLVLLDTNILVYAVESSDDPRPEAARALIERLAPLGLLTISAQVITEFFSVTTEGKRGALPTLTRDEAVRRIDVWLTIFMFLPTTESVVRDAVRAANEHPMHIYDAHIWALAKHYDIPTIITEDIPGQRVIEGVRYINPFDETFDYAQIGL